MVHVAAILLKLIPYKMTVACNLLPPDCEGRIIYCSCLRSVCLMVFSIQNLHLSLMKHGLKWVGIKVWVHSSTWWFTNPYDVYEYETVNFECNVIVIRTSCFDQMTEDERNMWPFCSRKCCGPHSLFCEYSGWSFSEWEVKQGFCLVYLCSLNPWD